MTRTIIVSAAILALGAGAALAQSAGQVQAGGAWQGIDGNRASLWVPAATPQMAQGVVVAPGSEQYATTPSRVAIR